MATKHQVTFYPVGNGDTTQIVLHNGRRILFDFCHRMKGEDDAEPEIDLKDRLKRELKTAGRDDFDVVAFTHADLDHIQGSTEFFWLDQAAVYQGEGRIKIKELWLPAAMLIEEATRDQQSSEFAILRQEGRHRLLEGKGIRVFSKPPELLEWLHPKLKARGESIHARDHLFVDAGTLVPGFDLGTDNVEFFCHSPFIEHCADGDIVRNSAALVFNVRFDVDGTQLDYLEIGDAEFCDIEQIVSISRYHGNEDRLRWDLLNIPHHCSYKALSSEKGKEETVPVPLVQDLLRLGQPGSYIVSCSCPIRDDAEAHDQKMPPHVQARRAYERYRAEVGGRRFLVTMEEPNSTKPEPIVFNIESGVVTWDRPLLGAAAILTSRPPRAG